MARELDLGPELSEPIGVIHRAADPKRMAVTAPPPDPRLVEIDQPFEVVVLPQSNTSGSSSYRVAIHRDGYQLQIKNRKDIRRAVAIAVMMSMSLACRNFYIYTSERPPELDMLPDFFTHQRVGPRIVCRLTDEVMRGESDGGPEAIESVFRELLSVSTGDEL